MRPGQRRASTVDAYGGASYDGHVDSIAAATGARFSLLPPENATGNYVKVVQRVPVKIVLDDGQDPRAPAAARHVGRRRRSSRAERAVAHEATPLPAGAPATSHPWLVAIAVMFGTFMEVLDTTVVNVSLPHIAGSLSATDRGGDLGAHVLPGRQRDHPADDRLAGDLLRPQAAADPVGHRLHDRVVPVRPRADAARS